jgi:hypothetical protein
MTDKLRMVTFKDKSTQFLMRGQSIVTDKEVIGVDEGIRVKDIDTKPEQKKTSTRSAKKAEQSEE